MYVIIHKMKKVYFILIILLGFLLMPNLSFACNETPKKSSCKTEVKSGNCKVKCCQKKSKNKSDKCCGGKCGKTTCQIQTVSFVAVFPNLSEIKNKNFLISTSKPIFYDHETNIADGFYSIWSPPNIG